jgi:general secretion pathway protein L
MMPGMIYIRIHPDGETTWWTPRHDIAVLENSLEEAARYCEDNSVTVFIPGRDVLLNQVSIPIKGRQRLIKTIPYALEDQFIDDIEELHFAIPEKLPDGATPVCSIKRSVLDEYLEKLHEYNIIANAVVPDLFALPWQESHWSVLIEKEDTLIRTGIFQAYSIDTENWIPYLEIAYGSHEATPQSIDIWDHSQQSAEALQAPEGIIGDWNTQALREDVLPFLVDHYHPDMSINLLQGSYQPKRSRLRISRSTLSVASLALVFIILQGIYIFTNYLSMSRQSTRMQTQIETLFHTAMPDTKRMVDPRSQMTQRLAQLKGGIGKNKIGFLELLSLSAPKLKETSGLVINSINYRDGNLDVDMNLKDVQMLEKLKQAIMTSGLHVEIRSATAQGDTVTGHLRIMGAQG